MSSQLWQPNADGRELEAGVCKLGERHCAIREGLHD